MCDLQEEPGTDGEGKVLIQVWSHKTARAGLSAFLAASSTVFKRLQFFIEHERPLFKKPGVRSDHVSYTS